MEEPTRKELDAATVISVAHQGSYDEIGSVYREIYDWAGKHGVDIRGDGLTVFLSPPNEFDWQSALFEVCLPVQGDVEGDARVTVKDLPECTVASVVVKGPYSEIPARYSEMLAWISANGWEITAPPREVYISRPDAKGKGDPNEFVTEIQFPINPDSS